MSDHPLIVLNRGWNMMNECKLYRTCSDSVLSRWVDNKTSVCVASQNTNASQKHLESIKIHIKLYHMEKKHISHNAPCSTSVVQLSRVWRMFAGWIYLRCVMLQASVKSSQRRSVMIKMWHLIFSEDRSVQKRNSAHVSPFVSHLL